MFDPQDCSKDKIERSVYITNLSFKINNEDLGRIFSQAGKVESSHVFYDKELLRPAGRGVVLFSKKEEAHRAIKELDNIAIKGRQIRVQINTKYIKLLNSKKDSVDEEDSNIMYRYPGFSGDYGHDNLRLSRRSSRHKPESLRHHVSHHEHHPIPINDYDYYDDYGIDSDYHRIIYPERDRERSRERDKSRHSLAKYDYDSSFDREIERKQSAPRLNEQFDNIKLQEPPIRDKKVTRIEYNDRDPLPENEIKSTYIYSYGPPAQRLPPSPPVSMIPANIPIKPSIHGINATDDTILDIGNDIPHSVWVKVIKKRSHDVYNELFSMTKDHRIIKEKTLLRFQPNEAMAVSKFIDALSSTTK